MHLVGVRVELPTNNPIVLLREADGDHRVLPIFIGAVEATAIAFALQGVVTQRPMTHDLMRDLLTELGIGVERIVITELRDGTFYAEIEMASNGSRHTVSSRPSDAIALAARLGTPIFANAAVLADAKGSGTQRRYSYRDLVELKVIKNLLDAVVSLQLARKGIEYIRQNLGEDIASASLVIDGPKSVLARSDGEVIDLMRKGQGVLSIVALGPVVDQLETAIHELRPTGADDKANAPAKAASGGG